MKHTTPNYREKQKAHPCDFNELENLGSRTSRGGATDVARRSTPSDTVGKNYREKQKTHPNDYNDKPGEAGTRDYVRGAVDPWAKYARKR